MPFELAQGASAAGVKSKPKQAELLLRRLELVKQSGGACLLRRNRVEGFVTTPIRRFAGPNFACPLAFFHLVYPQATLFSRWTSCSSMRAMCS